MDYIKSVLKLEDKLRLAIIVGCAVGVIALTLVSSLNSHHSHASSHHNAAHQK